MKLSDGEKLIVMMLADIYKHLRVNGDLDAEFISDAVMSGHSWAVGAKYSGINREEDEPAVVEETHRILTMWRVIDTSIGRLDPSARTTFEEEVGPYAIAFEGFDGNHDPHGFVAQFMVDKMELYQERKGRSFNSHSSMSLPRYRMMLARYERENLSMDGLTLDQLRRIFAPASAATGSKRSFAD